jgi:hypothetical protein
MTHTPAILAAVAVLYTDTATWLGHYLTESHMPAPIIILAAAIVALVAVHIVRIVAGMVQVWRHTPQVQP